MKGLERRGSREMKNPTALTYVKCLLVSYLVTAGLLLVLAFVMYRLHVSKQAVDIVIILIYIMGAFLAGFLAGGRVQERKFLFGLMMGGAFFAGLLLVTLLVKGGTDGGIGKIFTTFCLCTGGGMLGGMVR